MTTATNYIARITSKEESSTETIINGPFSRNEVEYIDDAGEVKQVKAPINICSAVLPKGKITEITLEVWSPTNVTGSLENRFLIE